MRLAAAVALFTAFLVSSADAQSGHSVITSQEYSSPSDTIIYSMPNETYSGQVIQGSSYGPRQQYSAQQQTFFGRWMELERRKNAWIRQRLFGR